MSLNLDTSGIRDLVEDATRHHGAPWKRVVSSDGGFYGVTDRNGSVVAGSPAVTALIAQAPTLIPELLDRLEQAEQDRDTLRNRLDAMRRQRDGYRNQLRKTEQQVQRVREVVNTKWFPTYALDNESAVVTTEDIRSALDGDTRRLVDQGLGDNLARTTKNGGAS